MLKKAASFFLILLLFFTISCATAGHVRPLAKGENRIGLSLGGPLMKNLGFPLPAVSVSAGYLRGITEYYAAGGSLNLSGLLFGFLFIDSKHVFRFNRQRRALPACSGYAGLNFMTDFKTSAYLFPELVVTASWQFAAKHLFYTGLGTWIVFNKEGTEGLRYSDHIIPQFFCGADFRIRAWELMVEFKWLYPWKNNHYSTVDYIGMGKYGALAPYFSVARRWGVK